MVQRTQKISVEQLKRDYSDAVLLAAAGEVLARWNAVDELPQLSIVFNGRLRTSGGRALLMQQTVELNPRLLAKNPQHIDVVLIHELAHLVATARYGRVKSHGKEWQQLMSEAGRDPKVCHSMDASEFYHRRRRPRLRGARFLRRILKRVIK